MKEFLTKQRGITEETLEEFKVSVKGNEAVLPSLSRSGTEILFEKKRQLKSDGSRSFSTVSGAKSVLFGMQTIAPVCFITEGETDCMRLWQELGGKKATAGVVGIPGVEHWKPEWGKHFEGVSEVYVVLDNDPDYNVQSRVDNCWKTIRQALGPKAKRIRLPESTKDVCEFFDKHSIVGFNILMDKAKEGELHFTALDLSKDPPPYEWLVKDWLCRGDMGLMIGPPNIGKSLLAMDLAVAVAEDGRKQWLGKDLLAHGRVLYFDEENPEDVVRNRLKRLGLTKYENIRYVHNQGIRVDRMADQVLEEAEAFNPTLIVFDSLTRFHTGDENNAGFINELFGGCFKPLARDTGSTVLVLHHVNKSEFGSSFVRARGSGDLTASIDSGFDVDSLDGTFGRQFFVKQYKSRRGAAGETIYAAIKDVGVDGLEVETIPLVL